MENVLKGRIISGAIWASVGQIGYYMVSIVANIILARILLPTDFGKIGIVLFFISIARVMSESGLGGAIIRNNQARDIDFSTIFIFNLLISIFLAALIIFFSGYIAAFYNDDELKNILAFSSLALIINAFHFIQTTRLLRQMRFKAKAIYDFTAVVISSTIAIVLAKNGYGVWSLVMMQMITVFITALLLWIFEDRINVFRFNVDSFLFHYKFGVNTTIASMQNSIFTNINQAIIGKYFSIAQTGFYYQANRLQEAPLGIISYINQTVIYSGLSRLQDNKTNFAKAYQDIIRVLTVFTGFISMVLYIFATEIVVIIYGENWAGSSFFLRILALSGFFFMQEMFIRNLFKIYNQTAYVLKLELVKKIVHAITLVISLVLLRIDILLYGFLFTSIFASFFNYIVSRKVYAFLGFNEVYIFMKLTLIFLIVNLLIKSLTVFIGSPIHLVIQFITASGLYLLGLILLNLLKKKDLMFFSSLRKN